MTPPRKQRVAARFVALAAILAGLTGLSGPTMAQATDEEILPDGIIAGRWILSPYARTSFGADDNLFRRPADSDIVGDQVSLAVRLRRDPDPDGYHPSGRHQRRLPVRYG